LGTPFASTGKHHRFLLKERAVARSKKSAKIILVSIFWMVGFAAGMVETVCHASDYDDLSQLGADLVWTMVNVNTDSQGDAHVIQTRAGETILIDCGGYDSAVYQLVPFLMDKEIYVVDKVFISHSHSDHYGGVEALINEGIEIKEIYFNIPEEVTCDNEAWGCSYQELVSLMQLLEENHIPIKTVEEGMWFSLGNSTVLKILYAFDGKDTPVGSTDLNDTSLIMTLQHSEYRFLFTGDLNAKLGEYLAYNGEDLKADILKVPHHGTEGCAPNDFFETVHPSYALVPSPEWLWYSERSDRIRNWFEDQNIPVYVNGIHGSVTVSIEDGLLNITTGYGNWEEISDNTQSKDEENDDGGGSGGGCFINSTRY
jgi:beta-lactamase superfamily II metal-dependent hydrolase